MVATQFFPSAGEVGAATGENFADALTGGTTIAALGDPMVLVAPTFTSVAALPPTLASYLASLKGIVAEIIVFGGTLALPSDVGQAMLQAVG
jgi:hypothetical protein